MEAASRALSSTRRMRARRAAAGASSRARVAAACMGRRSVRGYREDTPRPDGAPVTDCYGSLRALHDQEVAHFLHALDRVGELLGAAARLLVGGETVQRDDAALGVDVDLEHAQVRILEEI